MDKTMKAVITGNASKGVNLSVEKETVNQKTLVCQVKGELKHLVTVRWYMGRSRSASTVHCSVWIDGESVHVSGRGSAGGYGYHKESAAFQEALTSAGVALFGHPYAYAPRGKKIDFKEQVYINGCGDSSVDAAMHAIGRALFPRVRKFWVA